MAIDSTVNLGGVFTLAGLGTFDRTGGTVNLTGTLDNTGTTLALDATTGSWNLAGGMVQNGAITEADGSELFFTSAGGTLSNVTAGGNLDLATNNNASVEIIHGLTLNNATIYLGNADGTTFGRWISILPRPSAALVRWSSAPKSATTTPSAASSAIP